MALALVLAGGRRLMVRRLRSADGALRRARSRGCPHVSPAAAGRALPPGRGRWPTSTPASSRSWPAIAGVGSAAAVGHLPGDLGPVPGGAGQRPRAERAGRPRICRMADYQSVEPGRTSDTLACPAHGRAQLSAPQTGQTLRPWRSSARAWPAACGPAGARSGAGQAGPPGRSRSLAGSGRRGRGRHAVLVRPRAALHALSSA